MAEEKVSVIVPVYETEKYIRRCLDSIINQTYSNLEIILVDDGSPDNCGVICDEYSGKDKRIQVVHQKNGGVSTARNAGLLISTGKYIVFVDSDDSILPDYVRNLMSAGDDDYVVSGCYVQNEYNDWIAWENKPQRITLSQIRNQPEKINSIPTGMVWARRYKRDVIFKNSIFFREDMSRSEDILFNCVYLQKCNTISVINTLDYQYYYTANSATTKLNKNLFRWSMESVLAIGEIIGKTNQIFWNRVWGNVTIVCENYLHIARKNSIYVKLQLLKVGFEICSNGYVQKSAFLIEGKKDIKRRILVQLYIYPFYLFLKSFQ